MTDPLATLRVRGILEDGVPVERSLVLLEDGRVLSRVEFRSGLPVRADWQYVTRIVGPAWLAAARARPFHVLRRLVERRWPDATAVAPRHPIAR